MNESLTGSVNIDKPEIFIFRVQYRKHLCYNIFSSIPAAGRSPIRRAMEAAVSEEAFEEAARLRDELKKLQEGGSEETAKEGAGE